MNGPTPNGRSVVTPFAAGARVVGAVELLLDGGHVAFALALVDEKGEHAIWWDRYATPPKFRLVAFSELFPMARK